MASISQGLGQQLAQARARRAISLKRVVPAGVPLEDWHGASAVRSRKQYDGMNLDDTKRLQELEKETRASSGS